MKEYLVEWSIELSAESPEAAARAALAIQRDPNSSATVFDVTQQMTRETGLVKSRIDIDVLDEATYGQEAIERDRDVEVDAELGAQYSK